jgi:uncharacterized membrane protein YfcA
MAHGAAVDHVADRQRDVARAGARAARRHRRRADPRGRRRARPDRSGALSLLEAVAVLVAGLWAGAINTVVGSGTLVTFPVLLAVGFPPVVANVSNNIGLIGGTVSGAIGYRRELRGQRARILRLGSASMLGAIVGAVLLLELPAEAFEAIVPVFIVIALVGIILQPRLQRRLADRPSRGEHGGFGTWLAVLVGGVYGGYFGAAQGILLLSVLGLTIADDLQRINALKNVLAGIVNILAGIVFLFAAPIAWAPALLIGVGAIIGGQLGAGVGRRLSPAVLRGIIVVVGVAAIVQLLVR